MCGRRSGSLALAALSLAGLAFACDRDRARSGAAPAGDGGIEVRVVNQADRKPIPEAYVVLTRDLEKLYTARRYGFHRVGKEAEATSDADGVARFAVAPAPRQAVVTARGFHPFAGDLSDERPEIALKPILPLRGRVVLESGDPAPGARIYTLAGPSAEAVAGADGRFEIANNTDGQPLVGKRDDLFGVWAGPRENTEGEIVLRPSRGHGRVVDAGQRPLRSVEVTLEMGAMAHRQVTGADGRWFHPNVSAECLRPGDPYYPRLPCSKTFRFHLEGYVDRTFTGEAPPEPVVLVEQR